MEKYFSLNKTIGTVALIKRGDGIYELTKMAIKPFNQGKNLGQQLLKYCIDFAKKITLSSYTYTQIQS